MKNKFVLGKYEKKSKNKKCKINKIKLQPNRIESNQVESLLSLSWHGWMPWEGLSIELIVPPNAK